MDEQRPHITQRISFLGILGLFALLFLLDITANSKEWPDSNAVTVNNVGVEKKLISSNECYFRGRIKNIQHIDIDGDNKKEIIVVPQTDIYIFDSTNFTLKQHIKTKDSNGDPIWFGLNPSIILASDKSYVIAKGGGGFGDTELFKKDATLLWQFKEETKYGLNPDKMLNGDLDVDSIEEFYVNGQKGVYRLNLDGETVWSQSGRYNDIGIIKGNHSKESKLITLENNRGSFFTPDSSILEFWDTNGELIDRVKHNTNIGSITGIWDDSNRGIIGFSDRTIFFFDDSGAERFRQEVDMPARGGPYATFVNLTDGPAHIAVLLGSKSSQGKSVLGIYTQEGKLIYQEVLSGGQGLLALQKPGADNDFLIVGDGIKNLWVYSHNKEH